MTAPAGGPAHPLHPGVTSQHLELLGTNRTDLARAASRPWLLYLILPVPFAAACGAFSSVPLPAPPSPCYGTRRGSSFPSMLGAVGLHPSLPLWDHGDSGCAGAGAASHPSQIVLLEWLIFLPALRGSFPGLTRAGLPPFSLTCKVGSFCSGVSWSPSRGLGMGTGVNKFGEK